MDQSTDHTSKSKGLWWEIANKTWSSSWKTRRKYCCFLVLHQFLLQKEGNFQQLLKHKLTWKYFFRLENQLIGHLLPGVQCLCRGGRPPKQLYWNQSRCVSSRSICFRRIHCGLWPQRIYVHVVEIRLWSHVCLVESSAVCRKVGGRVAWKQVWGK